MICDKLTAAALIVSAALIVVIYKLFKR